jgi:hypothetical protein
MDLQNKIHGLISRNDLGGLQRDSRLNYGGHLFIIPCSVCSPRRGLRGEEKKTLLVLRDSIRPYHGGVWD